MKIYFAAAHAGYELKGILLAFVRDVLKHDVEDCGAPAYDPKDDYPPIIATAAKKLSADIKKGLDSKAVVIGASGQGEAMVANRFSGVRSALYYGKAAFEQTDMSGKQLDIIASSREHNDANALSLGARFLTSDEAREAVRKWLSTPFSGDERHMRRLKAIDDIA